MSRWKRRSDEPDEAGRCPGALRINVKPRFAWKRGLIWWRQVIESCHHWRSDSGFAASCDLGSGLGIARVMLEKPLIWVSSRDIFLPMLRFSWWGMALGQLAWALPAGYLTGGANLSAGERTVFALPRTIVLTTS